MAENLNRKKYRVSVDKTYTTRQFFEVDAPANTDEPEFHAVMAACLAGDYDPVGSESGASEGTMQYAELEPSLTPTEASPGSPEKKPEIIEVIEETQEEPDTLVVTLETGKGLHCCPDSGIPFIGYAGKGPVLPFEYTHSADERDEMIEHNQWAQTDTIVHMEWLDSWVNLDRTVITEDFRKYFPELLQAAREDILPYLNK